MLRRASRSPRSLPSCQHFVTTSGESAVRSPWKRQVSCETTGLHRKMSSANVRWPHWNEARNAPPGGLSSGVCYQGVTRTLNE
jgi:hypothetical protein